LAKGSYETFYENTLPTINEVRPHQSLEKNAPVPREIEPPAKGKIISLPQVGGLHHRYLRAA
jgi:hypothetical protein